MRNKQYGSTFFLAFLPILLLLLQVTASAACCQVCASLSIVPTSSSSLPKFYKKFPRNGLSFAAVKTLVEKRPMLVAGVLVAHRVLVETHRLRPSFLHSDKASSDSSTSGDEKKKTDQKDKNNNKSADENMSAAMITSIGIYKKFISPLLPPACRFVPTCSQYGVQAITEFGPSKGAILTAWRLLRCSPFGGKGYDPPKWPPVPYTYSSY